MARTSLMGRIEALAAEVAAEEGRGLTRRQVLQGAGALAAAASLPLGTRSAFAAGGPRIVVVGAGLAGLTAAYRLKQAGHVACVYEGSDRIGGRCWTGRGAFADGQLYEHGGELIDQSHTAIRQLVQELGLTLDNLLQAEANGTEPLGYFDGKPYLWVDATADMRKIWQQVHSDVSAASYPTLYNLSTERGRELDRMSIAKYLATYVKPVSPRLAKLLDVAYNIEYGAETTQQSTLNMLYLLAYSGQGNLRIFGPSNEKSHVRGGNDQITDRMAAAIGATNIKRRHELRAIAENADGTYALRFANGVSVTADRVIMAIPFAVLRASVDITKAGFKALKRTAIAEQGMGTNSKLHVQFTSRHWNSQGCNGETFSDRGYQNTWDVSRAQGGASGLLVDYTGGTVGASFGSGTPQERAQQFLTQVEPVLPGLKARYNGRATVDFWPGNKWANGSYAYWKVGQYQRFAGVEGEREGRLQNCHFAGEHTSIDFQGYLQGAVETGARAAQEVVAALRK